MTKKVFLSVLGLLAIFAFKTKVQADETVCTPGDCASIGWLDDKPAATGSAQVFTASKDVGCNTTKTCYVLIDTSLDYCGTSVCTCANGAVLDGDCSGNNTTVGTVAWTCRVATVYTLPCAKEVKPVTQGTTVTADIMYGGGGSGNGGGSNGGSGKGNYADANSDNAAMIAAAKVYKESTQGITGGDSVNRMNEAKTNLVNSVVDSLNNGKGVSGIERALKGAGISNSIVSEVVDAATALISANIEKNKNKDIERTLKLSNLDVLLANYEKAGAAYNSPAGTQDPNVSKAYYDAKNALANAVLIQHLAENNGDIVNLEACAQQWHLKLSDLGDIGIAYENTQTAKANYENSEDKDKAFYKDLYDSEQNVLLGKVLAFKTEQQKKWTVEESDAFMSAFNNYESQNNAYKDNYQVDDYTKIVGPAKTEVLDQSKNYLAYLKETGTDPKILEYNLKKIGISTSEVPGLDEYIVSYAQMNTDKILSDGDAGETYKATIEKQETVTKSYWTQRDDVKLNGNEQSILDGFMSGRLIEANGVIYEADTMREEKIASDIDLSKVTGLYALEQNWEKTLDATVQAFDNFVGSSKTEIQAAYEKAMTLLEKQLAEAESRKVVIQAEREAILAAMNDLNNSASSKGAKTKSSGGSKSNPGFYDIWSRSYKSSAGGRG